jgi:hypothetical protein
VVPVGRSKLTGGLTFKNRRGTLVDWNLCFNAHGQSTERNFKSATPAFMAPVLFEDERFDRRTLSHDMESFFAVIIWMATYDYTDETAFKEKPLAMAMLDRKKTHKDMVYAKRCWFKIPSEFKREITDHFEPDYGQDEEFLKCLDNIREILYQHEEFGIEEDDHPMKEGLFRRCMEEMDGYLGETKGCDEMRWIDTH